MTGNLPANLVQFKDPLPGLRLLLSYPLCNWVVEFFLRSREYEKGLEFISYAYAVMGVNIDNIPEQEYTRWEKQLTRMTLTLLDYMNSWEAYIDYYDQSLASKPYIQASKQRYEIIRRKLARQAAGKSVEHLKRHGRAMLTEEELNNRYAEIINKLEWLMKGGCDFAGI